MPKKNEKKVALITGGSRGIGKACIKEFANKGYDIAFTYFANQKKAEELVEELQKKDLKVFSKKVNNSNKDEIKIMVQEVIDKFGQIDVLVNNAGISEIKDVCEICEDDWDNMLDVNLKGAFFFSQFVFSHMKKKKTGNIINIASQAATTGGIAIGAHYCVSKAGLLTLTKSFAKQGAPLGIRVNSVSPGIIETDMIGCMPKNTQKDLNKKIPMGRIGTPQEVATVVSFLESSESKYITGANIPVNGGMLMQ